MPIKKDSPKIIESKNWIKNNNTAVFLYIGFALLLVISFEYMFKLVEIKQKIAELRMVSFKNQFQNKIPETEETCININEYTNSKKLPIKGEHTVTNSEEIASINILTNRNITSPEYKPYSIKINKNTGRVIYIASPAGPGDATPSSTAVYLTDVQQSTFSKILELKTEYIENKINDHYPVYISDINFSDDGNLIAMSTPKSIYVFNVATSDLVEVYTDNENVLVNVSISDLKFSPDNSLLTFDVGYFEGMSTKILDLTSNELLPTEFNSHIEAQIVHGWYKDRLIVQLVESNPTFVSRIYSLDPRLDSNLNDFFIKENLIADINDPKNIINSDSVIISGNSLYYDITKKSNKSLLLCDGSNKYRINPTAQYIVKLNLDTHNSTNLLQLNTSYSNDLDLHPYVARLLSVFKIGGVNRLIIELSHDGAKEYYYSNEDYPASITKIIY